MNHSFLNFSHHNKVVPMININVPLDPSLVLFYGKIAETAGLSLEQVLSDALFKLAGELSLEALHHSD